MNRNIYMYFTDIKTTYYYMDKAYDAVNGYKTEYRRSVSDRYNLLHKRKHRMKPTGYFISAVLAVLVIMLLPGFNLGIVWTCVSALGVFAVLCLLTGLYSRRIADGNLYAEYRRKLCEYGEDYSTLVTRLDKAKELNRSLVTELPEQCRNPLAAYIILRTAEKENFSNVSEAVNYYMVRRKEISGSRDPGEMELFSEISRAEAESLVRQIEIKKIIDGEKKHEKQKADS